MLGGDWLQADPPRRVVSDSGLSGLPMLCQCQALFCVVRRVGAEVKVGLKSTFIFNFSLQQPVTSGVQSECKVLFRGKNASRAAPGVLDLFEKVN